MINLFEPRITAESIDLLRNVFESKWLGRGAHVTEFEKRLAAYLGVPGEQIHTVACCTDVIFSAYELLGIDAGAEIIVPSVSFPAVGSAALAAGMRLRIVDIDPSTGNISIDEVERSLSPSTAAVFVTHYGGIPVDIHRLRKVVGPSVRIIEDAACAFGTFVRGQACGTQGDLACWSFDAMKLLSCGEGGALYMPDGDAVLRAKEHFYLGLPAQSKSGIDRVASEGRWWEYQLNSPGRRSIFTNINAAIGLPQFETLGSTLQRRAAIRAQYTEVLDAVGAGYLRQDDASVSYSNYFFTVVTPFRDELAKFLKSQNIYSTFRYYPLHLIELFAGHANGCEQATRFSDTALNIPIHQSLSDSDVAHIAGALKRFFASR